MKKKYTLITLLLFILLSLIQYSLPSIQLILLNSLFYISLFFLLVSFILLLIQTNFFKGFQYAFKKLFFPRNPYLDQKNSSLSFESRFHFLPSLFAISTLIFLYTLICSLFFYTY